MAAIMMNGQLYGSSNVPVTDASDIDYNNSASGMTATNVQGAIDEHEADVSQLKATKQDAFTTINYATWQTLSPQQKAAKPYYISDYPSTAIIAGNVGYSNSTSGMSADDVQEGLDELASEKQDKTDNSLTTTAKTVVGGINELKSGLTNVESTLANKQYKALYTSEWTQPLTIPYSMCVQIMASTQTSKACLWTYNGYTEQLTEVANDGLTITVTKNNDNTYTISNGFGVVCALVWL